MSSTFALPTLTSSLIAVMKAVDRIKMTFASLPDQGQTSSTRPIHVELDVNSSGSFGSSGVVFDSAALNVFRWLDIAE
jgi:hypothetical protein